MKNLVLILLLFICAAAAAAAETGYRLVHPDGSVEFTDDPLSGGEGFELRVAPATVFESSSSPAASSPAARKPGADEKEVAVSIQITAPQADQTLWFDGADISVSVAVTPGLESGQQIAITLDGKEIVRGTGSSLNIGQVFRGSHTIGAAVVAADGKVISTAPSIPFHVRQHSSIKREPPEPIELE